MFETVAICVVVALAGWDAFRRYLEMKRAEHDFAVHFEAVDALRAELEVARKDFEAVKARTGALEASTKKFEDYCEQKFLDINQGLGRQVVGSRNKFRS